jgi:hypothetical protein
MMAKDHRQQVRLQLLTLVGMRAPISKTVVTALLARLEGGDDRANAAMALGDMLKRATPTDAAQVKRIRSALERTAKGPTGDCKGAAQCARMQATAAAKQALSGS